MHDERSSGAADQPHDQDVLEHGVLHHILALHPAHVRFDELVREMGEEQFLVEDAVTQLVADGLLYRHDEFVLATRAAVRFDELET
ncbi:MAG TPA: hypothetical protein VF529_19855 [Solirubrobacteraceae bacterium]|jgi:predicted transcriptional regulator